MSRYAPLAEAIRERRSASMRLARHEHVGARSDRRLGRRVSVPVLGHAARKAVKAIREQLQKLLLRRGRRVVDGLGHDERKPGKGGS